MINDAAQEIVDMFIASNDVQPDPSVIQKVKYALANYGLACIMDSAVAKEAEDVCLMEEDVVEIRV